jgi:hypothetical protein
MIENTYKIKSESPSDINEHLPTLKKYSSECDHVTEMGVRSANSTWGLLAGRPKKLMLYDIYDSGEIPGVLKAAQEENIDCSFYIQNVIEEGFEIEETDFLFIDTLHAYSQLKKELEMHASKVKKFMAFHDTVSYGERDEVDYTGVIQEKHKKQGLNAAINEFLESNPQWSVAEVFTNNNGLTVLKRK